MYVLIQREPLMHEVNVKSVIIMNIIRLDYKNSKNFARLVFILKKIMFAKVCAQNALHNG